MNNYPIISTIVFSTVLAFILGYVACKLRLPSILGYLAAGVILSPNTPGITANVEIAQQLAEIGIILLMFEVGIHFSTKDLLQVKNIALIGSLTQMFITMAICSAIGYLIGFNIKESIIYGVALSVASTVVMLRQFEQYRLTKKHIAKIATGWLITEDIAMIIILFIIPIALSNFANKNIPNYQILFYDISILILKITIFVLAMITIGKKILPTMLISIYKTRSRELVSLSILAIACGFAFVAHSLFGTSFALGAFIAGFILNESKIGSKTIEKSISLRDIFAVLFFVSVGLIFDPHIILSNPELLLVTVLLIIFLKTLVTFVILKLFRKNTQESLVLAVSFSQIGEFSFILVALCSNLNIISSDMYNLIISGAVISIIINPFIFKAVIKNFAQAIN